MEERPYSSLSRPRSTCLDDDSTDELHTPVEEFELQSSVLSHPVEMGDVIDLLHLQYAIITGGKSKDGCPVITFPDNTNFHALTDADYQKLMLYLTSVPSLQEADLGFHLVIDRRKDRWNSVKAVLLKISVYFPGLVHVAYVVRPTSFLQKALTEVSNKLFKEEFKFRVIIVGCLEELHGCIDSSQLTSDLGGTLLYAHDEWIQQRIALDRFSTMTGGVSHALDDFTKVINETEFPNDVETTQELLNVQTSTYSNLKDEILAAAKHGEELLMSIRNSSASISMTNTRAPDTIGNVFAVEHLLVQLEETERTFDDFWQQHLTRLRHCLELRCFEQEFRELQLNFNLHSKTIAELTVFGDSTSRIDILIQEALAFEKLCLVDIDRAEEVVSSAQQLLKTRNALQHECVTLKCEELDRIRIELCNELRKRKQMLMNCRNAMEQIEKAKEWCSKVTQLLNVQNIEECAISPALAGQLFHEIQQFLAFTKECRLKELNEFCSNVENNVPPETNSYVLQVMLEVSDISVICEKHIEKLGQLASSNETKLNHVQPEQHCKSVAIITKLESIEESPIILEKIGNMKISSSEDLIQQEIHKVKRGHVLAELIETERIYVAELLSILQGYKKEAESESMHPLLPPGLPEKLGILFGNLDEIYRFHNDIFLKDLENCITETDLVALCFVQKRDSFYHLYSFYCQNIPRSEQLRETLVDSNMFFQTCQKKLGHKLPLAAYLLKPVQRITKYQLLLKDLLRYSNGDKCTRELQQALDCMLVVLRCVNDSMHQISISGFPVDLSQQGDLLLQGSFSVWTESKKDLRLRIKPVHRHIFLYQKAVLFCKPTLKTTHNNSTYHFKHYLKMSQIGLTESVKGDVKKFEVWLQGRQEVHTIQASNVEQKQRWVNEIKRVLLNQLEELKDEKTKQYSAIVHQPLRQTTSWEKQKVSIVSQLNNRRAMSIDSEPHPPPMQTEEEANECLESGNWSSDYSNSDDEEQRCNSVVPGRFRECKPERPPEVEARRNAVVEMALRLPERGFARLPAP